MKIFFLFGITIIMASVSCGQTNKSIPSSSELAKTKSTKDTLEKILFIDVHDFPPGKVTFADVMKAHQKDLATESKYDVNFIKFWVDEEKGKVYCLSSAKDSQSIIKTHTEASGSAPAAVFRVTEGEYAKMIKGQQLFFDVHNLGPGKVTKAAVAEVHKKDLAVQKKYDVNLINYWVDEKDGKVFCLSQGLDSTGIIHTHKEAHGLLPAEVLKVKQGE